MSNVLISICIDNIKGKPFKCRVIRDGMIKFNIIKE